MTIPSISKEHYDPRPIQRSGCPCQLTPSYRTSMLPAGERRAVVHELTTMFLAHQTKTGQTKNSLPLEPIHHQLELDSLVLSGSGASNILLSKVSFDCLIVDQSGKEIRDYISFDLRIPGANTEQETVFSYEMIEAAYGGKENLYSMLQHFYSLGRSTVNPHKHKHGHCPDYDSSSSKHDQYIRHTEQLLVAYLALPQAADMLCNRLRTEIRGKYPDASTVKIYNMGLHMHSTKTCCAPCEYSLIGLMNDRKGERALLTDLDVLEHLGFLPNFKKACSIPSEQLTFTLPKKSSFRLLVTVTASEPDAHHQKQPKYIIKKLNTQDPVPSYIIPVKSQTVSRRIFTTMLDSGYDLRKLPASSTLSDKTVGISGSKATPGSPGTINKVTTARKDETTKVAKMWFFPKV